MASGTGGLMGVAHGWVSQASGNEGCFARYLPSLGPHVEGSPRWYARFLRFHKMRAQGWGHVAPEVGGVFAPGGRQYVPTSGGALSPW